MKGNIVLSTDLKVDRNAKPILCLELNDNQIPARGDIIPIKDNENFDWDLVVRERRFITDEFGVKCSVTIVVDFKFDWLESYKMLVKAISSIDINAASDIASAFLAYHGVNGKTAEIAIEQLSYDNQDGNSLCALFLKYYSEALNGNGGKDSKK